MSTLQLNIRSRETPKRLSMTLRRGDQVRIGRAPQDGQSIPWDPRISREHADLSWSGRILTIRCLPTAQNAVVCGQERHRELQLRPGTSFRIGQTSFDLIGVQPGQSQHFDLSDSDHGQTFAPQAYSATDLRQVQFRNSERQLEILARLPALISEAETDTQLQQTLCSLLLEAIPQATAVAVAQFDMSCLPDTEQDIHLFPEPTTMRMDLRDGAESSFRPSRRLIQRTLLQQESVLHIWNPNQSSPMYTVAGGLDWAACTPVADSASRGWCLYVAGTGAATGGGLVSLESLTASLRFAELVAQFIGSIRHVRHLQEQKTQLSSFFCPGVIHALTNAQNTSALQPDVREITVLFCDLRGFSRKSEQHQHDLLALLQSVNESLSLMVQGILDHGGAIADFQGDAALGFWGWPVAATDGPLPACRAALQICQRFQEATRSNISLLQGVTVGLGIAHGQAVAGQIGPRHQSKIGVFGPVVNQGARLESMTRAFGISICVDEATATAARALPDQECQLRSLGLVRAQGMDTALRIHSMQPAGIRQGLLTESELASHEAAVQSIIGGRWADADQQLQQLPRGDGPRRFLQRFLQSHNLQAPTNWDGTFSLATK